MAHPKLRAAVLGGGAAGLVTARELRRQGHSVVVFEQGNRIGGVWTYDPRTEEDDPIGLDASRARVHGSMYKALRTNLSREVMGFRDFPFVPRPSSVDLRRFPGHEEVLVYLEDFAAEFGLMELVRLETKVVRVALEGKKWRVTTERNGHVPEEEEFEAVVVCNGHHSQPRVAEVPGVETWPGKQIHSHNYRTAEPFKEKVVVVIGKSSSGADISAELTSVAKEVHLCARTWDSNVDFSKPLRGGKLWKHLLPDAATAGGKIHFADGSTTVADIILHCTGYSYDFPFLDTDGLVTVDDNRVGPLYKHVFPPSLAPFLSFVGLPFQVAPFPLCELQAKWIALVLSGTVKLPSEEEMMQKVFKFYARLEDLGVPKRYTHCMSKDQFEYCDWLADQCGCHRSELWRRRMNESCQDNRKANPDEYRDSWNDEHWLEVFAAECLL